MPSKFKWLTALVVATDLLWLFIAVASHNWWLRLAALAGLALTTKVWFVTRDALRTAGEES